MNYKKNLKDKIVDYYDEYERRNIYLAPVNYCDDDGVYIILYDITNLEPYINLTRSLEPYLNYNNLSNKNCAYVDTNNFKDAIEVILENKLGTLTREWGHSGYCNYPEVEFDHSRLVSIEEWRRYEKEVDETYISDGELEM